MSGTGSNLNVGVAADTRQLEQGMARAKAAVQDFSTTASQTSAGLNQASASAQNATASLQGMGQSAQGVAKDLLAAGTAGTQGAFAQIPGVTAEMNAGFSAMQAIASRIPGVFGLVGAAAMAAAAGVAYLTLRTREYNQAAQGVFSAAMMQGRNADFARMQAESAAGAMTKLGTLSLSEAMKIAGAIGMLPGITEETRGALLRLAPALHEAFRATTGGDATKTAEEIAKVFQSTQSVTKFVQENALVAGGEVARFNEALGDTTGAKMQELAIAGLDRRWGQSVTNLGNLRAEYKKWVDEFMASGKLGQVGQLPDLSFEAFQRQRNGLGGSLSDLRPVDMPVPQSLRDYLQIAGQIQSSERELMQLQSQRGVIQARIADAGTDAERRLLQSQLRQIDQQIQLNKAKGDTSWELEQRAALERERNAVLDRVTDAKRARTEILRVEEKFWLDASRVAGLTQSQITTAETNAAAARRQLRMLELQDMAAAGKTGAADAKRAEAERVAALVQEVRLRGQLTNGEIQTRKSQLDEEVAAGRMSHAQATADFAEFVQAKRLLQLQGLNDALAQVPEESAAARALAGQKLEIEQQLTRQLAQLRAADARDAARQAQEQARIYEQAFSGIESSFKSSITGLIAGTTTWAKATQGIMQSIIGGFVDLGMRMVGRWLVTQLAMSRISSEATAQRVAMDQTAGNSGWGALLASWLGLEAGKTGATAAGVATRTAITVSGTMTEKAAEKAAAMTSIGGDAAAAAAGAYKAVVGIPIIGPILAPAAAAVAFAAVMAFGGMIPSFDAGTMNVPADMTARIHKGEMIVPASVAGAWRAGQAARGFDGGFGGGGITINPTMVVQPVDAASFVGRMKQHGRDMAIIIKRELALNPSSRPTH